MGHHPPISTSSSAANASYSIPTVDCVRDLKVRLHTTFTSSVYCRNAAKIARRLLFLVRRSFSELSKAAFTPLYCSNVRPHLEYAMEAKFLELDGRHSPSGEGSPPGTTVSERLPISSLIKIQMNLRCPSNTFKYVT